MVNLPEYLEYRQKHCTHDWVITDNEEGIVIVLCTLCGKIKEEEEDGS